MATRRPLFWRSECRRGFPNLFAAARYADGADTTREEASSTLKVVETADDSITFWNENYKEHYHTPRRRPA